MVKNNPKILHICSNFDNFFYDFFDNQVTKGMNIRAFSFKTFGSKQKEERDYVDFVPCYSQFDRFIFSKKQNKVYKEYLNLYKNEELDLIHAHTLFSNGEIALRAHKEFNIPYIVAVRDTDLNIFMKYRKHLNKLATEILLNSERIVFLSENYRQKLLDKKFLKKHYEEILNKSVIIPNGISEFYHNNYFYKSTISTELDHKDIVTVGYISKRKNQITVAKTINKYFPTEYQYLTIGKVKSKRIFNKLIQYPFYKYINFMGKEELINYYRSSYIFVMPSITETFGLTYVEAMSQGLPVIYSRGQGFDGQIEEGVVGYSVDPFDKEEISKAIDKISNNYQYYSLNATNKSREFNWSLINDKYNEIYDSIT